MRKKHKTHHEEVYRLHIDAVPHVQPHHTQAHAVKSSVPHVKKEVSHSKNVPQVRRKNKTLLFIWDKVQFVLVSIIVFAVIYVILNWQALSLIVNHRLDQLRGVESPLETLVAEKPEEPERLIAYDRPSAEAPIPPLNLEVYPSEMRLIIPRINQNLPVVGVKNENLIARKWDELEADIQEALKNGVIHYPGTALPGDNGNVVITGHSSYYVWDAGRFKDVFALLHDVRVKDKIVIYFNQKKYIYEASEIKTVASKDVDVLKQTQGEQLTLITCTPIGTNLKRLIVIAKLVQKN